MPNSFSTSYLVPAILCNPLIVLHGFNTFASHVIPSAVTASSSARRWLEPFGPVVGTEPLLDVHLNEKFCWSYTMLMVLVQLLAFGRVSGNRMQKNSARAAAKLERERQRRLSMPTAECKTLDPMMNGRGRESGEPQEVEKRRPWYEVTDFPTLHTPVSTSFSKELFKVGSPETNDSPLDTSEEETIM